MTAPRLNDAQCVRVAELLNLVASVAPKGPLPPSPCPDREHPGHDRVGCVECLVMLDWERSEVARKQSERTGASRARRR